MNQAQSPILPPLKTARSGRTIRIPRRFEDYVPHGDMSMDHVPPPAPITIEGDGQPGSSGATSIAAPEDARTHPFQTRPNKLGVFRRYTRSLTWQPANEERLALVCDSPSSNVSPPAQPAIIHEISFTTPEAYEPFTNHSTALFMQAYFSGMDTKSEEHANLVAKILEDKSFRTTELKYLGCSTVESLTSLGRCVHLTLR